MVALQYSDLDLTLPDSGVRLIFMHPFLRLSTSEPFKWLASEKDAQIRSISRCLEIASSAKFATDKIHFTVFPEYSIPGLEGIATVEETLASEAWQDGTVVIGGIDGLNHQEYSILCRADHTYTSELNKPENAAEELWVNCLLTWLVTRDKNGYRIIERWVQPKLCPSWEQERINAQYMFEGKAVYVFEGHFEGGRAFRFFSLLCYDWVAPLNSGGIDGVLNKLNESWGDSPDGKFVHLVFVLQHNKKPNHASFLSNAITYFNEQSHPFVNRRDSTIIFVNTAGKPNPGPVKEYGFSSMVYSPIIGSHRRASPPSYAISTKGLRKSDALQTCQDVLLRENGACIHSIHAFYPRFLQATPAQTRHLPLGQVSVHSLDKDAVDPRTPGEPVSAIVKWTNDRLDLARYLEAGTEAVKVLFREKQDILTDEIRWCKYERLKNIIGLSLAHGYDLEKIEEWLDSIDDWSDDEENSFLTLLHVLSIISCLHTVKIKDALAHAYMVYDSDVVDIIVVSGHTHATNLEHAENLYPGRYRHRILIISRDRDDTPIIKDRDRYVNDVTETKRCGFHDLKSCLSASSPQELAERVHDLIGL